MKINTGALVKAGGIGAAITLILAVIGNGIGLVSPELAAFGLICCCAAYLFYAVIGVGYAWFAAKDGVPLSAGPMALGGALSALIAGVMQAIVNVIATLIIGPEALASSILGGLPSASETMAGFQVGFAIGLVGGACVVLIVAAIMGAIGGALYGGVAGRRQEAPPAL